VKAGALSAEEFAALINRSLEGTPVAGDERELARLGRLEPKDLYATAVVLADGEARTAEEAPAFRVAEKRPVEARQGSSVLPGRSA
jgi:hypothetical protein